MGLDLKLVDADGVTLPTQRGVVGRLRVKGPSVAERYFGDDQAAVDSEGYLDTGDLASIDVNGNLTIAGRVKELIKSGGEWINPREIEDIVGSMPAVALVAVIAREHPKWGERPLAVLVVGSDAVDTSAVQAHVKSYTDKGVISRFAIPDRILFVDALDKTSVGKIDKKALRAKYGDI